MIRSAALRLVDDALAAQQRPTAIARLAWRHHDPPPAARTARELIPLSAPGPGQQYAFEVDLDRCTGCKSCVAACHSLNGLDAGELWRSAGLLHGGTPEAPVQQTVTSACHHCVDPACMTGCPVLAYEKDPITGIVRHFDDQCIGCQYCVLMCPYDAPKYDASRGIVRKCDMCQGRLAAGEPPACVQACPNESIAIGVVERAQAVEDSEAGLFLPGVPPPGDTVPTTVYATRRVFPKNLLPADFYTVSAQHAHPALVVMLVLTQLSAGAFGVAWLARPGSLGAGGAALALGLGLAALGASLFHVGRPRLAYRALLGLRTSWLSREILAFSLFAAAAAAYALALATPALAAWQGRLAATASLTGAAGVGCSVMVYAATRRAQWRAGATAFRFVATSIVLGTATVLVASGWSRSLAALLVTAAGLELAVELGGLRHVRDRHHSPLKRTAILMTGDLKAITLARFACGAAGGVIAPALAASHGGRAAAITTFVLCLAGELCARHLFFATATGPSTPGAR